MPVTLLEAWNIYRQNVLTLKNSKTLLTDEGNWRKHVDPFLSHLPLECIKTHQIAAMRKTLEDDDLSPQTVKHCLALIKRIMRRALEWEMFSSPVPVFRMPVFDNRRVRFLTPDEAQTLLLKLKTRSTLWHDISAFALYTGLRRGEIFRLTAADIDLQSANVYVIGKNSKNKKHRFVPLNSEAMKIASHYAERNRMGALFQNQRQGRLKVVGQIFRQMVEECGFNHGLSDRLQRVVFHTFRHTFASWLVQRGTPLVEVCSLLGHSNINMTMRYAHLAPDHAREAVSKLILSSTSMNHHKLAHLAVSANG